ncbi:tRNA (adenosine(37)-N6)-threonylcarbamoyltransferase complex ATPase subunit type 1 TsaE [Capnocytophaga felis]|uniref:tRNA threonylcarbamoyladenosine biosynthesis protein TsaE n=1 Tax=Capnocytophaga felis TaxID=2267611 RepID=A0A5M4BB09_9FLAO|nr:tRNA (adenosine(37)-N6)-threonylcarbamoyltransferase complex ATPase subunit type 1 TsaE [Capnocytophaga felis]GET46749.1 tRNA (adenosine(37)-N6)-threonylcarbamoyltransferase complex ATPase subunit type 1 TsaE [Capnocytophaga felis]GET48449.1 tRNA (adenosine(37)-N6)-threonylcarbamoyltransferase complex ATPase subunit type 1 TsaE [Capnocytophaga felis]
MEITYSLSEIDKIAQQIIPLLSSKIVIFEGSMGMGKTTLIKSLVKALGINDVVASPTFGLVNHYESDDNTVYHFDFYRIEREEEAFDIGFEEYLYSGAWCFIEWAERVSTYLPEHYTTLEFQWIDADRRKLKIINPSD